MKIIVEDLTGKQFGAWKVLYRDTKKYKTRDIRWVCKCECGTVKSVFEKYLKNGKSVSCGCKNRRKYDGQRYGKLVVVETLYGYNGYNRATCKCLCDCGNTIFVKASVLPKTNSCGCSRCRDLTGRRFGSLVVKEMLYKYKNNVTYCKCTCDCGNKILVRAGALTTGNTTSCGCKHSPSLIGEKFGRLTVIAELPKVNNKRVWQCECECGNKVSLLTHTLTSGHTSSCGCLRSELHSKNEMLIRKYLFENSINFIQEYSFSDCKGIGGRALRFDFYLPDFNTLIEYDGMQHFKPIDYFGGHESFNKLKINDQRKNLYCKTNGYTLIRLPYPMHKKEIENQLYNIISNPVTITA